MNIRNLLIALAIAIGLSLLIALSTGYFKKPAAVKLQTELYANGAFGQDGYFAKGRSQTTLYVIEWSAPQQMTSIQHVIITAELHSVNPGTAIARHVHADMELSGAGFNITAKNTGDQKGLETINWHWEISPKEQGDLPIELILKSGVMKQPSKPYLTLPRQSQ